MLTERRSGIQRRCQRERRISTLARGVPGDFIVVKSRLIGGICVAALSGCSEGIHNAVARNHLDTVSSILERDPDACDARDRLGKTPMHFAVNFARPDALGLLIAAGCDINAADVTGMTPLHVAAFIDLPGAATMLIENGADKEARDKFGNTPLDTAAIKGATRTFEVLVGAGADANASNIEGLTPKDLEEKHGQTAAVDLPEPAAK
jgi:ankyrin repeat protein